MCSDDEPSFSLGRIECRLFHLIYRLWPMHALTLEAPLATASKEGFNGWLFLNWIRWSARFPSLLTWLTSEYFWMFCLRPLMFLLRVISKSSMSPSRTIALTSDKYWGVNYKTSAHRSSVPWTPEENAKNSYEDMAPTTNRSLVSRMRPLYFHRIRYAAVFKSLPRFQIPSIWFRISRTIPCQEQADKRYFAIYAPFNKKENQNVVLPPNNAP